VQESKEGGGECRGVRSDTIGFGQRGGNNLGEGIEELMKTENRRMGSTSLA